METTLQRSQRSQRQQKYQHALRTLTLFKMAANTNIKRAIYLALFMEEVQKNDCLYNKYSKEYRDKAQENQLLESNRSAIRLKSWTWVLCLSRLLLCWKTPIITRKHASCRSRRFRVEEWREQCCWTRSPRSSFSDRSDHMETIIRCDRWTIFVSDRSDDSDCSFHMETRLMKWMGLLSYRKKKPFKIPWHPNIRRLC